MVPAVTVAGPVLVTDRSAEVVIAPVTVEELLPLLGSEVVELTEAVSEKFAPFARVLGALTTTTKVSVWPLATVVAVAVVPLTVKVSGLVAEGVRETSTAPVGKVSLRLTLWASDGPLFVKEMV